MSKRKFLKAFRPLQNCGIPIRTQKKVLHEMFVSAVTNAPEDEVDNFTAKKFSPVYLALCEVLDNVPQIRKRKDPKKPNL